VFIPYRPKIKLTRFPIATIVVVLVCIFVYWNQDRNQDRIIESAKAFCTKEIASVIDHAQRTYIKDGSPCWDVLAHIYTATDPKGHLAWHLTEINRAGDSEAAEQLREHYGAFVAQAPRHLTASLWQYSGAWNPVRMLTATISHGSWDHLVGNLFFFVAFALVVETVIGPVLFVLVFLTMGLAIGSLENMLTLTREGGAGLGLSGVVMGVMTLAAYFAPRIHIKHFYFFFFYIGVLSVPLWAMAVWYVMWDLIDYMFLRDFVPVAFAAHLAGAAVGLIVGITVFRAKRHWVAENLIPDERPLTEEEPWLAKMNTYAMMPIMIYYGLVAFIVAAILFAWFVKSFLGQLLIAAPAIAAGIQIYRLKRPKLPDFERYQRGIKALEGHHTEEALRHLQPLADRGYPRAQLALGRFYSSGPNRSEAKARDLIEAAATRGLTEAQYELGIRYLHGQGFISKDLPKAITWLEQAAAKGNPDAANSLGYIYEHALGRDADPEKAIEWYYRAGVGYHKAGRVEDAKTTIKVLNSLAGNYPAVLGLVAELNQLVARHGRTSPKLGGDP